MKLTTMTGYKKLDFLKKQTPPYRVTKEFVFDALKEAHYFLSDHPLDILRPATQRMTNMERYLNCNFECCDDDPNVFNVMPK